jgi:aspartokinase/homoserine dehydrogenase 1
MQRFYIHKFGGSSVADAACMTRVAEILEADSHQRLAAVLSACRGVTDALLGLVASAERQSPDVAAGLDAIRLRHVDMATTLLDTQRSGSFIEALAADCRDVAGILSTVRLTRTSSAALRDLIAGFGELWSSRLFTSFLQQRNVRRGVSWVDARDVIEVDAGPMGQSVRWPESMANLARHLPSAPELTLIIPGFVARDAQGLQTTLGRNGSDYSASIFGKLLDAAEIHIWTDVDGILTADPRLVPDATLVGSLSYHEAMELAYFGAKVVHPQTMTPAVERGIPLWIRNTFRPELAGSVISSTSDSTEVVKGISSIDGVALINLEGAGMIGVPGTAYRLFSALREHGISVILISQASSEHSICFAVPLAQAEEAERIVRAAFDLELRDGKIQSVDVTPDCSILAVVGDGMAGTPGVAAKIFGALSNAGVNVRAIAQGASERNISVMIDSRQTARALRSVHSSFYLSPHTVSIGLIGPGLVGSALIEQLASQTRRLKADFNLDLRLRGIMSSSKMLLDHVTIDSSSWRSRLAVAPAGDLDRFVSHIHADHLPHAVLIDCTASDDVAAEYPKWLAAGIHVVTPNKKANSGSWALYSAVADACRHGGAHYLYEATVGAGLPVVQTLRDLRETGDDIRRVDGILSGTLSYLFNVWTGDQPFSAILLDARRQGFTEPDPRDDLSGMDVARKLIILAREMGLSLELSDVEVENLVPPPLAGGSTGDFLERASDLDGVMSERLCAAQRQGRVLRYVAGLDALAGRATVGLVELERSHPFANINRTDNVVRYVTARYDQNPLVVQGPGAGPAVTAGGVFADLLRVCAYLGARKIPFSATGTGATA